MTVCPGPSSALVYEHSETGPRKTLPPSSHVQEHAASATLRAGTRMPANDIAYLAVPAAKSPARRHLAQTYCNGLPWPLLHLRPSAHLIALVVVLLRVQLRVIPRSSHGPGALRWPCCARPTSRNRAPVLCTAWPRAIHPFHGLPNRI